MDELIKQVVERTGISEQQARGAVDTVLGFLKTRLPEPIAGQLDGLGDERCGRRRIAPATTGARAHA